MDQLGAWVLQRHRMGRRAAWNSGANSTPGRERKQARQEVVREEQKKVASRAAAADRSRRRPLPQKSERVET